MDTLQTQSLPKKSHLAFFLFGGSIILLAILFFVWKSIAPKKEQLSPKIQDYFQVSIENRCGREEGLSRSGCVVRLALDLTDTRFCNALPSEEEQSRCADLVLGKLSRNHGDYERCFEIRDTSARERCILDTLPAFVIGHNLSCNAFPADSEPFVYCDDWIHAFPFINSGKTVSCESLKTATYKNLCFNGFSADESDADGDSLPLFSEIHFGTDPENPDTDRDGFLDGAEVKNGYDPLGNGKLQSTGTP